jgi:hypothetical protein
MSHLLLNHLSLVDAAGGADALREMLRLYDYRDTPETRALISGIGTIKHRRSTARVRSGGLAWASMSSSRSIHAIPTLAWLICSVPFSSAFCRSTPI